MGPDFQPGQPVLAQNALGEWMLMTAISGVELVGRSRVVWICDPKDWGKEAGKRNALPWPVAYVRPAVTPPTTS